jgi:hypothetical protein
LLFQIYAIPSGDIGTCATILLAFVGLQMVYRVAKKPLDWYKWSTIGICLLGLIFCITVLPWLFGIEAISLQAIVLTSILGILSLPLLHYVGKTIDYCWTIPKRLKERRANER